MNHPVTASNQEFNHEHDRHWPIETNVHAPIEKVWEAYTTPDTIVQWNAASDDWHTTRAIVDLRVGDHLASATCRQCMLARWMP